MGFSLGVAFRFLKKSRSQTMFIILGIAIGVSVQVFVGTLITSLQQSLINRTVGSSPHITVQPIKGLDQIDDVDAKIAKIQGIPGVTKIAAASDGQLFIGNYSTPIVSILRGFDLDKANEIFHFLDKIQNGTRPKSLGEVLIGKELFVENNMQVGDNLTCTTGKPPYNTNYTLKIAGVFDLGVASINRLWMISDFETVNSIFNYSTNRTSISIQVADVFQADVIASNVSNALADPKVKVTNWKDENAQLLSGLNGQTISSVMIQVFVIVSVVIGISSVLAITVLQKSKQIGILKAMGVNDTQAAKIFLFQGFFLGLGGAILGIGLGLGLMIMFSTFARNPDGTALIDLFFDYQFIVLSGIIAILASVVSSLIPAKKSSGLSVIEVIRNG